MKVKRCEGNYTIGVKVRERFCKLIKTREPAARQRLCSKNCTVAMHGCIG